LITAGFNRRESGVLKLLEEFQKLNSFCIKASRCEVTVTCLKTRTNPNGSLFEVTSVVFGSCIKVIDPTSSFHV